jgi:hypothetical protein
VHWLLSRILFRGLFLEFACGENNLADKVTTARLLYRLKHEVFFFFLAKGINASFGYFGGYAVS